MAWAYTLARTNHNCPRCGAARDLPCRMPSGRKSQYPHQDRMDQLTTEEWKSCEGEAIAGADWIKRFWPGNKPD